MYAVARPSTVNALGLEQAFVQHLIIESFEVRERNHGQLTNVQAPSDIGVHGRLDNNFVKRRGDRIQIRR